MEREGDLLLLLGDFNDYILSHRSRHYFSNLELIELITDKHGPEGPGSTRSYKSNNSIDGIWGSPGLVKTCCVYILFNYGLKLDHTLVWVKIHLGNTLGDKTLLSKNHWLANSASTIWLVRRNISASSDILPDNTTCFLVLDILRITKHFLPHQNLSRRMKKSENS